MASVKEICVLALQHIGQFSSLVDLEENSAHAIIAKTSYPFVRDSLLERHAWNFATSRVRVAPLAEKPLDWLYAYPVPHDNVRILSVVDLRGENPTGEEWILENVNGTLCILTNLENAVITYVRRIENPNLYSPLFADALSWSLSAAIAGPIVKGTEGQVLVQKIAQYALVAEQRAIQSDVRQRRLKKYDIMPDWLHPEKPCCGAYGEKPTPTDDRGEYEK